MVERLQTAWHAFREESLEEARRHPGTAAGLVAVLGLLLWLIAGGVEGVRLTESSQQNLLLAIAGGFAGLVATAAGGLLGLGLRGLSGRAEDTLLGFAAGMMLAAASFSLIVPGIEAGEGLLGSASASSIVVAVGLGLGAVLMMGLDRFMPHEHPKEGACGPAHERINRAWLFVLAIALHNLPEGMAIGVGFSQGDLSVGLPLATAIAIQDIPEGLAIVMSLRAVGISMQRSVLIAAASGLMEPVGAALGWALTGGFALAYPLGMGVAAGAMIFVVSHEVIPETHRGGHQRVATLGLLAGFALMMMLDNAELGALL